MRGVGSSYGNNTVGKDHVNFRRQLPTRSSSYSNNNTRNDNLVTTSTATLLSGNKKKLFIPTNGKRKNSRSFVLSLFGFFMLSIVVALFFPTHFIIQQQKRQQQQQQRLNSPTTNTDNKDNFQEKKVCFINSVYSPNPNSAAMDKVTNATVFSHEPNYKFYYFTNLINLETPGWTKILTSSGKHQHLPDSENVIHINHDKIFNNITRHITMSRYPKFMSWKYPFIRKHCGLVVYLDGYWSPQKGKSIKYKWLMNDVHKHPSGLWQVTHPFGNGIKAEMDRIVSGTKDTQQHVDMALKWFERQEDFDDNCTLYWNGVFAYDPTNLKFQQASTFFWNRFSLETDSWRDQPFWAYSLHHFEIQPIIAEKKRLGFYVKELLENKGDHHYNETTVTTLGESNDKGN